MVGLGKSFPRPQSRSIAVPAENERPNNGAVTKTNGATQFWIPTNLPSSPAGPCRSCIHTFSWTSCTCCLVKILAGLLQCLLTAMKQAMYLRIDMPPRSVYRAICMVPSQLRVSRAHSRTSKTLLDVLAKVFRGSTLKENGIFPCGHRWHGVHTDSPRSMPSHQTHWT